MTNSCTSGIFLRSSGLEMWIGRPAGVHDARQVAALGADQHAAREEVARVEAADGLDVDEALVCDVTDKKADLVHVAKQHDLQRGLDRTVAVAATKERAHRVGAHLVEEPLDLGFDQRADAVLVPGHAWGFAKAAQQVDVHERSFGGFGREVPSNGLGHGPILWLPRGGRKMT